MRHYLDVLAETIRDNWDKPALTDYAVLDGGEGSEYTYGDMYRKIIAIVQALEKCGLQSGDHIAICGGNSANWLVAYLAIASFRGVSVTVLNSQMPDVIAWQVSFADCRAMFAEEDIWRVLPSDLPVEYVFSLKDFSSLKGNAAAVEDECVPPVEICFHTGDIDDLAQICFTSGSTDEPKAVMLSFRNLSSNIRDALETFPCGRNLKVLSTMPMAHIYGLMDEVLGHLPHGHHIFFVRQLSHTIIKEMLRKVDPYVLLAVPLLIEQLFSRHRGKVSDIFGAGLKQIFIGGSILDSKVEEAIASAGLPLTVGYGSTETAPLISASRVENYKPHSCGQLVSGMEARISDEGEILVRGDNVMLGYYKNPEATRRKIDADEWLHTGDRGRIDEDRNVYVYGRMEQDMIVLPSGENVIPQNIEALMDRLDGVKESLVLERNGRLVALIYPSEDKCPDKDNLLRSINIQLPSFSQISDIELVAVPFQRTGKSTIKRYLYK